MFGELTPLGGGESIPLLKKSLMVGRRESCDVVLRFSNVSAHHCQLTVSGGYWYIRDLQSRNGVKVNGVRVSEKRLDPGDAVSIAKHRYEIHYCPSALGAVGPPPPDEPDSDILGKSLLERAGLDRGRVAKVRVKDDPEAQVSYDLNDDSPGQLRHRGSR